MESSDLRSIVRAFPDGRQVEQLVVEEPKWSDEFGEMVDFASLMCRFPNVKTVVLGPLVCFELAQSFELENPDCMFGWKRLKKLTLYFLLSETNIASSFISFILNRSIAVSDVEVLIHSDVVDHIGNCILSKCMSDFPKISDSTDLARCRLSSKTLTSLSHEIRSITLVCSSDRYLRSISPEFQALIIPFKTLIINNIYLLSKTLNSISLIVERPLRDDDGNGYDESDDLYLTSVDFVAKWLPKVDQGLRSLSISDYWTQSCWRRSHVLGLISSKNLLNLELKNAWLSVEGLKPMPMLTSLTLEFVRLDDEDLRSVNECFPSLQILNLIGVGFIREPKIHLLNLKTFKWTVSNAPLSLTIDAPNLVKLQLKCVQPEYLFLKAPLLSVFDLSVENTIDVIEMHRFLNLKSFRMESSDLRSIVRAFPDGRQVEQLVVEEPKWNDEFREMVDFESLMCCFPNVKTVVLGPLVCFELAKSFELENPDSIFGWKRLKKLTLYFLLSEMNIAASFISFILNRSIAVSDVEVLVHSDVVDHIRNCIISKCMSDFPKIRWKLGIWKEGREDSWTGNDI
ncbi:F-box/LRR-repeat protein [Cinnamomum micranthum f. kanehirae]|uniref:F-box/LRR-repeat protein n=1 Tax=Cinnamomum micranthum f. kanehirae TaxID=337451 RepID=A0A443N502_9MAGN|nr:F-box/LRR-repeat protein [Cinnamomum micranthum f. kanehirae]